MAMHLRKLHILPNKIIWLVSSSIFLYDFNKMIMHLTFYSPSITSFSPFISLHLQVTFTFKNSYLFLYISSSSILILFLLTFRTKNPLIYLQFLSNLHLWVDVPLQQKQNTKPKKVTRHKQDSKVTKFNFLPDGDK